MPLQNNEEKLMAVVSHFHTTGDVISIKPLGDGLINDTFKVTTAAEKTPDYVLQRINHQVFQDVDLLQHNIEVVTNHLREKLKNKRARQFMQTTLTLIDADNGKTYFFDGENYWRMTVFIEGSHTIDKLSLERCKLVGQVFGNFEALLADLPEELGETIPDFHNMSFRLQQLYEAVEADKANRGCEVYQLLDEINQREEFMCHAEELQKEGKLYKHVCHCDTKLNNILFDDQDNVLCVIDLDTVMPSFVFSDYGDFLRTAACTAPEDEPDTSKIAFDIDAWKAFTSGYMKTSVTFLSEVERECLPYATALFPYMQCVRFLTDYLNGDVYYKTSYPEHNLVRAKAQFKLLQCVEEKLESMRKYVDHRHDLYMRILRGYQITSFKAEFAWEKQFMAYLCKKYETLGRQ